MKADPKVIASLQRALQITITTHEVDKVYRRVAKRRKYKGLRKWFNKSADASGEWRWCIEGILAGYNEPITVTLNDHKVDTTANMISYLTDQGARAVELRKLYHEAYEIAENSGDSTTASKMCDLQDEAECQIRCLEAFSGQINDMGAGVWLSTMKK